MSTSVAIAGSNDKSSPKDRAICKLCAKNFHRVLWLPETNAHAKLRVTYSTTSNFDDTSIPAILFIGPMFCSRWHALDFDKLAQDCGVRLICTDRPAMGGSTAVAIDIRISVWLETVPALLQKLDTEFVSLLTHSAGAIYTLNTLAHLRKFLDPTAPVVAFLAPYVPMTDSGARLTSLLSKIPTNMLDSWADIVSFVQLKILPSASWSGGLISSASAPFCSTVGSDVSVTKDSNSTTATNRFGEDKETSKMMAKLYTKYQFTEDVKGINQEAKLCLRKCQNADLGTARDYARCISSIMQNEYTSERQHPGRAKLLVAAFFSGSDIMSGKRGQEFFEQCWQQDEFRNSLQFTTKTYPKADHDSLLIDHEHGALRDAFLKVAESGLK